MTEAPAFPAALRERLAREGRLAWSADVTENHFAGLAWMCGEAGSRQLPELITKILGQPPSRDDPPGRGRIALERLGWIAQFGIATLDEPAFSESLRNVLRLGKYTRWAETLSAPQIVDCMELMEDCRMSLDALLAALDRHPVFDPWLDDNYLRNRTALDGLVRFLVRGDRYGYEQARLHITGGIRDRYSVLAQALPAGRLRAAKAAFPEVEWSRFGQACGKVYFAGEGKDGKWMAVTVDASDAVTPEVN